MTAVEAELVQITNDYIENECEVKGLPKETNLTEEQNAGMKELLALAKDGQVFVGETHKSSKLNINTLENYTEMAEPHIRQNKVVTNKEVATIELLMNGHTFQLCRIHRSLFWTR